MNNDLKKLAGDAIMRFGWGEFYWHEAEGWGIYKLSKELLDLLKEAKRLDVIVPPLYEGHQWPDITIDITCSSCKRLVYRKEIRLEPNESFTRSGAAQYPPKKD